MEQKRPLGATILGGLNFFIFGLFSGIMCALLYLNITPQNWVQLSEALKAKGLELNLEQFKGILVVQIVISLAFTASGMGVLLGKEWGRKSILYLSFLIVSVIFLSVLRQPGFIGQAVLQIVYPGILIFYFTNKNVESYFRSSGG